MSSDETRPDPDWPTSYAFVVQFRRGTGCTPERFEGAVEHVVSEQTTTFASWVELAAFLAQVLERETAAAQ